MDKTKSMWHWITALLVLIMMFTCTLSSSGFAVTVNAIKVAVGLDGVQSSMVFTIKNLSTLLFVFVADKYYKKVGLRIGVFSGFLMGALAMTIFLFSNGNLFMIYTAAFILGGTYAFSMLLPMALIIQAWFKKNRAFAMSIGSAGTGIHAMLVTPYLQSVINSQGLAAALHIIIGMFLVVGTVFVFFIRSKPEDRGLEPYGGNDYAVDNTKKRGSGIQVSRRYTAMFMVCAGLMGFAAGPTQQYFILHFNQLGYDSMLVAAAYSVIGIMLIIFKLSFGTLSTKFNFGIISSIFLGFYVLSCVFAAGAQFITSPVMVYGACALLGVAGAVSSLGYPNWIADTNPEDYTKCAKNAQSSYQGIEVLGSFVPGIVLDLTGHYTGAYIINGILFAIVLVCVLRAYTHSDPQKEEASDEAADSLAAVPVHQGK